MIVQAFLHWAETAKAGDRTRAAQALAKAFLQSLPGSEERHASVLAMTCLLDDPSPKVRLALAQGLATSDEAPRAIMLALAEDQPEIACTVIAQSPVLSEADLVDLAGRGHAMTRSLIAARPGLGYGISAAIAEIGDEGQIRLLLENDASISRLSLRRIAERFGGSSQIRELLLDRRILPADARHMLVSHIADALAKSDLVQRTIGLGRIDVMTREAGEEAAVAIAGSVATDDIPALVDHLKADGKLTPALLIHALCSGKIDFFAQSVVSLASLDEKRVRAILATGRVHAVRALFQAAGIGRDIVAVFVEAVFFWRRATAAGGAETCYQDLLETFADARGTDGPIAELLNMVEQLHRGELRRTARTYAADISLVA